MEYRFDPYTRSFSAVYPEYDEYDAYNAYYSAADEEEAARKARNRRRMRNLAIGAGAAAALTGGGLLYLRHKGNGNIGKGFMLTKHKIADKLTGGKFTAYRDKARSATRAAAKAEAVKKRALEMAVKKNEALKRADYVNFIANSGRL